MTTHLIVDGHGAGDPGGVGNGTNERDFTRKTLHPYIKKWTDKSKDSFVFYDLTGNKDLFQETAKGFGMYSITSKQYASVTEIHLDASASASATGGHTIISSSFKADKNDLNLATVIKNIVGWWGSVKNSNGISYRSNLLNLNVAAQRGINYRLMELGFITNSTDMRKIRADLDGYAKGIVEGITGEKLGSTTVANNPAKPAETNNEFHTTTGKYICLKDTYFFKEKELTNKSSVNIKKGQVVYADEVVIEVGKDGKKYYRGAWQLGKTKLYFSLNKNTMKK